MTTQQTPPVQIRPHWASGLYNSRKSWLSVLIAGILGGGLGLIGSTALAADPAAKPLDDSTRKFLAQHCQACHSGPKPKGNFLLENLSQDFSDKENRQRWLAVLEQIKAGTMPPKAKPRPPAPEAQALVDWISGRAATEESARQAAQGRVVLRR
ncbi:MAG: hypothetical protein JWN70_3068, partial [Planctomycetaceae bacterium]|nr:hypothetical protein [Planctomycetaceae bacterium]